MKEKNCKKEIYSQIIETAHQLFIEHGIKDVKMDDIAAKLSISKRTIYELFNDKEDLLREVLKLQNEKTREKGKDIIRNSKHILEIILRLYNLHFELLKRVNSKFFSELNKYPEICKEKQSKEKQNAKIRKQFFHDRGFSFVIIPGFSIILTAMPMKNKKKKGKRAFWLYQCAGVFHGNCHGVKNIVLRNEEGEKLFDLIRYRQLGKTAKLPRWPVLHSRSCGEIKRFVR